MNNKGQGFSVFNLLVQAIIGLFILVIIISALTYFEGQKFRISMDRFEDNLVFASQQPNGDVLVIEEVVFNQSTISKKAIATRIGIGAECIDFEAKNIPAITVKNSSVVFNEPVTINVYLKCYPDNSCNSTQGIRCIVSFGKRLENGYNS